jgi:hypothetical protein
MRAKIVLQLYKMEFLLVCEVGFQTELIQQLKISNQGKLLGTKTGNT